MEMYGWHDRGRRATGRASAVGLGCGLALSILLVMSPASADETTAEPMLSVAVDDGRTSAKIGDLLDYTITVENMGADAVSDLRVTQTMPNGLDLDSADRGGVARKSIIVWSVDLAPGRTRELHSTMTVGVTPDHVLRMATVVCVSLSAKDDPLVCATHSDELPAGSAARAQDEAAADAVKADEAASASPASTWVRIGLVGGGAAAIVAVGLAIRRSRGRGPRTGGTASDASVRHR